MLMLVEEYQAEAMRPVLAAFCRARGSVVLSDQVKVEAPVNPSVA